MGMDDIQNFAEESVLTPVKSSEPLSGAELLKQELLVESVETFDKSVLNKTETQAPLSGPELAKKEIDLKSINDEVEKFDKSDLKETEVEDINVYKQTVIEQEKPRVELIGGIENFDVDNLQPVKTNEPLSGADLLKQELTHKAVHSDLENFDVDNLQAVKTNEPLRGVELLKHELTQKAVGEELENFNKESMKPVDVTEKNILPDTETLQTEKTRENLLKGVEEFSQKDLSHVQTAEPLSGAELLKQELSMKSIVDSVTPC